MIRIAPDELIRLAKTAHSSCSDLLVAAIEARRADLEATSLVNAAELLATYRVRLARWQAEGVPAAIGLPEFVAALDRLGDSEVVVAGYDDDAQTFVVLVSAGLDTLLGCIAIRRSSTMARSILLESPEA